MIKRTENEVFISLPTRINRCVWFAIRYYFLCHVFIYYFSLHWVICTPNVSTNLSITVHIYFLRLEFTNNVFTRMWVDRCLIYTSCVSSARQDHYLILIDISLPPLSPFTPPLPCSHLLFLSLPLSSSIFSPHHHHPTYSLPPFLIYVPPPSPPLILFFSHIILLHLITFILLTPHLSLLTSIFL